MSNTVTLSLAEAERIVGAALIANRTSQCNATSTARALVHAEVDGQAGHGLSRVPSYAAQARVGKVDGHAQPRAEEVGPAALRVDGALGFAYPAIDLASGRLPELARRNAIAIAALHRSHHFGQAGAHAERLAREGVLAIAMCNSPRAMAFWGGSRPMLGTNPIAFACPMSGRDPLVIDLALSTVARGKIMAAQRAGTRIPEGWALDNRGQPTTDPAAALEGSMLPIGGAKGAALALMVEILSAALTGSHFGWEASSFLDDKGAPPAVGQILIAIDPNALSGGAFASRMESLMLAIAEEPSVRLPGERRLQKREHARRAGLVCDGALYEDILNLGSHQQ